MKEGQGRLKWESIEKAADAVESCSSCGAQYILPPLVWGHRANVVIEVGVAHGYTTTILAESLVSLFDNPAMMSVDNGKAEYGNAARILSGYAPKLRWLALLEGSRECDYVGNLQEHFGCDTARLILVDAQHEYEHVKADIEKVLPALHEDGVLVLHDFCDCERYGVIQAAVELFDNKDWWLSWQPTPIGKPYGIVKRRKSDMSWHGNNRIWER